jgi:cathepsin D
VPPPRSRSGAGLFQINLGRLEQAKNSSNDAQHYVVPLERVDDAQGRRFFVGKLFVGSPQQKFRVLFDTSSGFTVLPHAICRSKACKEKARFSPKASNTSVDVDFQNNRLSRKTRLVWKILRDVSNVSYTAADIGTGSTVGALVRDTACLQDRSGKQTCAKPIVVMSVKMDDVPFRAMPTDGIVGLGLTNLSSSPHLNFFGNLVEASPRMASYFGMYFGPSGGELHVGGYNPALLASPVQWFDVHSPEEGFWQVAIKAVRVGNMTLDSCERGCHAIVDTSAHRLGVQESNLAKVKAALTPTQASDNSCRGPELEFDLGGMSVTLRPEDYTDEACATDLGSLDLQEPQFTGVYAFGEMVLRHYFVVFDWKTKAIGFAPLTGTRVTITI